MAEEATTPSSGEGEAKPEEDKGAITSEGSDKGQDPKKPEGEPADPKDKKIAELEGQVEDLDKKLTQATNLQSQADRKAKKETKAREKLEKTVAKIKAGEISADDMGEESDEDEDVSAERTKARMGIQGLFIGNAEYNQLLNADITLREVVKNNPLALLDEFFSAEDAVAQFKQKMDEMVDESKKKAQPKEDNKPKEGEEGAAEFEAGPTQPGEPAPSTKKPEETEEPVGVDKVEESIKSKIKVV